MVDPINITDVQANETNVDWYADGERANSLVLNRPIKQIAGIVNEVINDLYGDGSSGISERIRKAQQAVIDGEIYAGANDQYLVVNDTIPANTRFVVVQVDGKNLVLLSADGSLLSGNVDAIGTSFDSFREVSATIATNPVALVTLETYMYRQGNLAIGWGYVGDGVVDDAPSLNKALQDSNLVITPVGTTPLLNSKLTVGDSTLNFMFSEVLADHNDQVFTLSSGKVLNAIIDGNAMDHTTYPSEVLPGDGATIKNVFYKNFHGITAYQTYPIKLPLFGAKNFVIEDVQMDNITQDDNGAVTGKGFVGGIFIESATLGTQETTSSGRVKGLTASNIYSVDAGSGVVQDSDLIRGYWDPVNGDISTLKWDIDFIDITARNVGKRVFKTGGINGCTIRNVRCYKDDGNGDMYSVISLTSESSDWVIDGVVGEGDFARGIEFTGNDHLVENVNLKSTAATTGYGLQMGGAIGIVRRARVSKVHLEGFSSGIYFYDSFDSTISQATLRDNASSVLTFNASGGNVNSIKDFDIVGGLMAIDGGAFLFMNDIRISGVELSSGSYTLDLRDGSINAKNILISANLNGRRCVNLDIKNGATVQLDDFTVIRNSDNGALQNDHCIFTTQESTGGGVLRGSKIRVVSNINPDNGGAAALGRELVLLQNINFAVDKFEIQNNAPRNSGSADFKVTGCEGVCKLGKLETLHTVSHGNIDVVAPTDAFILGELNIENGFANSIQGYVGTAFLKGGATLTNTINTPNTITIP